MLLSEESKQLDQELDIMIALREFDLPELGFADLPTHTWVGIAGITAAAIANRIGYCKLKYKDDKSKAKKCVWWWVKDKKEKNKGAAKTKTESTGPNLNKELKNIMDGGEISPRAKTYADYRRERGS
jgi:hypothetical protein